MLLNAKALGENSFRIDSKLRKDFEFCFLELLKQKTINSLMILQNTFTSGKLLGNMETTGVD